MVFWCFVCLFLIFFLFLLVCLFLFCFVLVEWYFFATKTEKDDLKSCCSSHLVVETGVLVGRKTRKGVVTTPTNPFGRRWLNYQHVTAGPQTIEEREEDLYWMSRLSTLPKPH